MPNNIWYFGCTFFGTFSVDLSFRAGYNGFIRYICFDDETAFLSREWLWSLWKAARVFLEITEGLNPAIVLSYFGILTFNTFGELGRLFIGFYIEMFLLIVSLSEYCINLELTVVYEGERPLI